MTALLAWITGGVGRIVAPFAVALAVIGGIFTAGRRTAKTEAERDALRRDATNMEKRHAVEADVAREPDPIMRLRERWGRD